MTAKDYTALTSQLKARLIEGALDRRQRRGEVPDLLAEHGKPVARTTADVPEQYYRFSLHPGYKQITLINENAAKLGIVNPYFKVHEGIAGAHIRTGGRDYLNFASYNYLGYGGDPRVGSAAKAAVDRYGTSVSASRLVSGEREIHRELERALATAYGVDDAIAFVSGHATNVTVIGHLFGPKDLVLHDEFIHNSVSQGIKLSGAHHLTFPHNDCAALDAILAAQRGKFERVLIVVEGVYSMDGDFPDLPRLVEVKRRRRAFLMVDEAHSFGVMGRTGLGIREHFALQGADVDIWMGTLSKSLASCGGYIAGESALIEHLKFLAPGFLYSVGMTPPAAAAALAALECMRAEPERVAALQQRGILFRDEARAAGIDVGSSAGFAIVPAITGGSIKAVRLARALFERGIHVQPILYPAVSEQAARLRFFLSCAHTEDEIRETVRALRDEFARI